MSLSLEDRLELHELAARYGDLIDAKTWDQLDRIFTEDAAFTIADPDVSVTLNGLDEIKAFMAETDKHPLAHLMANIYAEPAGVGSARLFVRAMFPVDQGESSSSAKGFLFGAYTDEVVKTDQGWRIRNRVFNGNHRPSRS